MKYRRILITGGAGFIGSNLAVYLARKFPKIRIIVFDNLKRRGSELNISRLKSAGIIFIHGDIRNPEDLKLDEKIDLIIDCSAEPSVLAAHTINPLYVINTNLVGTINCLEVARKNKSDLIFLSTSRIYPYSAINMVPTQENKSRFVWKLLNSKKINGLSRQGVSEVFSLSGYRSLYGVSKLSCEFIIQEYVSMYGIKAVINRCGVVSGPWQFGKTDQGVFSLWLLYHYFKQRLSYIGFGGKGKQVRDVLHIDDLINLILIQIENMNRINGFVFNIGGGLGNSLSLFETTQLCKKISGNKLNITSIRQNRPEDIKIYISDCSYAYSQLNWKPQKNIYNIFEDMYGWIKKYEQIIHSTLICS